MLHRIKRLPSLSLRLSPSSRRPLPPTFFSTATPRPADINDNPTVPLNVLGTPLALHSLDPPTGWYRDGYCNTDAHDHGAHTLAAVLTPQFLKFTASRGNNLSGLKPGCKWCLCVSRWVEAWDAYRRGEVGEETVPRVVLESTHVRTLREGVGIEVLKGWEVGRGRPGGSGKENRKNGETGRDGKVDEGDGLEKL